MDKGEVKYKNKNIAHEWQLGDEPVRLKYIKICFIVSCKFGYLCYGGIKSQIKF